MLDLRNFSSYRMPDEDTILSRRPNTYGRYNASHWSHEKAKLIKAFAKKWNLFRAEPDDDDNLTIRDEIVLARTMLSDLREWIDYAEIQLKGTGI